MENIKSMWPYKHFNTSLLALFCCLSFCKQAVGQVALPKVGESIYSYAINLDAEPASISDIEVYDLDFHCMDMHTVIASQAPRIDFEIKNQHGVGEAYSNVGGVLTLKGFHMVDPYFGTAVKFNQLIGGIPLMDLNKIDSYNHEGTENLYFEYSVSELPDLVNLWAESFEYQKLRLKVSVTYKTSYKGEEAVSFFGHNTYHKLYTEYEFQVVEVKAKKEEWTTIEIDNILGREQYLQNNKIAYYSYYNTEQLFPLIRLSVSPEVKLELYTPTSLKALPICGANNYQIYVYPNPTLGDLNVRMMNVEPGSYDLTVYNIVGYKIWETTLVNGEQDLFKFKLPNLEKGVYLYSIRNKEGRYMQSRRLTVLEY